MGGYPYKGGLKPHGKYPRTQPIQGNTKGPQNKQPVLNTELRSCHWSQAHLSTPGGMEGFCLFSGVPTEVHSLPQEISAYTSQLPLSQRPPTQHATVYTRFH